MGSIKFARRKKNINRPRKGSIGYVSSMPRRKKSSISNNNQIKLL